MRCRIQDGRRLIDLWHCVHVLVIPTASRLNVFLSIDRRNEHLQRVLLNACFESDCFGLVLWSYFKSWLCCPFSCSYRSSRTRRKDCNALYQIWVDGRWTLLWLGCKFIDAREHPDTVSARLRCQHWRSWLSLLRAEDPVWRHHVYRRCCARAKFALVRNRCDLFHLKTTLSARRRHHAYRCHLSLPWARVARSGFGSLVTSKEDDGWVLSISF